MQYFFNIRDGVDSPDNEGVELHSLDLAYALSLQLTADLLRDHHSIWQRNDLCVEVTDSAGLTLFTVHALALIAPAIDAPRSTVPPERMHQHA